MEVSKFMDSPPPTEERTCADDHSLTHGVAVENSGHTTREQDGSTTVSDTDSRNRLTTVSSRREEQPAVVIPQNGAQRGAMFVVREWKSTENRARE